MKINYRQSARKHKENAEEFASMADGKGLRAACLELRMAIEALTYENLQTYTSEVGGSAMEKWQPRKVIDELLYIDPHADQTAHISIGREEEYGEPSKNMQILGTDHKFTVRWANKAHNALGSYLHEPTISQHKAGKSAQDEKMKVKVNEILAELEPLFASKLWGANFGQFVSFDCECGFKIKRKQQFFEDGKELSCANCGRLYEYEPAGDRWHVELATMSFPCLGENCSERQTIARHDAKPGFEKVCQKCGSKHVVQSQLAVALKVPHPNNSDE